MYLNFFGKVHSDLNPVPYRKAVLYSLLIPALIISLNEKIYHPFYLTVICLLIGYKDNRPFVDIKQYKLMELLRMTGITFVVSALFSLAGLKLMSLWGVDDPQGLKHVVYSNEQYVDSIVRLPFTAIGEEFFKLLIFLAFFSLVSVGSKYFKIFVAALLASFMFGHMHVFNYELTAGVPIMLGAIPTFYLMLYYRSILPLIIEHFLFDLYSYTAHTVYGDLFVHVCTVIFIFAWFGWMIKSFRKKRPTSYILNLSSHLTSPFVKKQNGL